VRLACRNRNARRLAKLDALIRQEKKIEEDESSIHSWILQGDLVHRNTIAGNQREHRPGGGPSCR
jgi:hypothetical protein